MDRGTVFTKTAKGLMEATGKTSALSRNLRGILKEIDGKATVGEVQTRVGKVPEAKLQEALETLTKDDFIREFTQVTQAAASPAKARAVPPLKGSATGEGMDLDFTVAIPTVSTIAGQAEAAARQKAEAAAAAAARAEAEAEARAKAAAAVAAARAKAEAEARAQRDAEERARREAEERARKEAEERAKAQEQARIEAEARARKEAEERARVEAELKARLEEEGRAREEAEEKARREADELRAKLEEERRAREEAERKAKEQAERERREAEEKARREADELRAKLEEERRAREESERKAKEEAERKAEEDAERSAREQAERSAKEHAERSAREHAERVAHEAEERARKEQEDLARREAEARARKEAEERARREAEDQARRKSEDEARRDEEERRRKDEQERQRKSAGEQAREEPGAWEREHAEERARLKAENEETERHFADMEKELEAEAEATAARGEKAPPEPRQDARKRDKEAVDEHALAMQAESDSEEPAVAYRTPVKWGKPVALSLLLVLVLGLVLIHFVSFDGYISQFEKQAGAQLQQPVKIKALHLSLVPLPHWRLDGVSVGNEGQLVAARINAVADLGSLFSDKKVFRSIELESPVLSEAGLVGLLFGKPREQDFKVANVIVKNGKLDSKTIILPALDARIAMGEDGAWRKIALDTPDHKTSLTLEPGSEGVQLVVETNVFSMPFGPAFLLEDFSARGVIGRNELRLNEFKGGIYGGYLSGNASLKWGTDWSLGGELSARAIDPGTIVPALLQDGKLEGKAGYAMHAKSYDGLFAAPRLEGTFAVQKGSLLGVDLARLLQGGGAGGKTAYTELSGSFMRDGGKTQLRQIRVVAGPVSAGGNADVDAGRNIGGRFAVELKSPVAQARASFAVSGTLREPRFSR